MSLATCTIDFWECTECGHLVEGVNWPSVCINCGEVECMEPRCIDGGEGVKDNDLPY